MCSMSIIWAFIYRLALLKNKAKYLNSPLGVIVVIVTQLGYEGFLINKILIKNNSTNTNIVYNFGNGS